MPLYKNSGLQNLIDLINQDNPGLPFQINETECLFGTPVAIATLPNGHNTRVKVLAKSSGKYRGSVQVTYRRIDLSALFRSVSARFDRYLASGSMTHSMMIPIINQKYGLNLEVANTTLSAGWSTSQSGQSRTLSAVNANYFYVGSLSVQWFQSPAELGVDILLNPDLNGAAWPGGNDFTSYADRSLHGEFLLASLDFTEFALANGWPVTAGGPVSFAAGATPMLDEINAKAGTSLNINAYNATTNPQGLGGYTYNTVPLPNASWPMANREGFTAARIFNTENHPTFKGKIVVYFNN